MGDLEAVARYFARKGATWKSTEGSVAVHVRRLGRNGLVAEFRADRDFDDVRDYVHRVGDVQYVHDAGFSEFRTRVRDSLFGSSEAPSGAQRQANVVARAALLACGVSPFGARLVRIAGALPRSESGEPPSWSELRKN